MHIKSSRNAVELSGFGGINLAVTLNCGQAFRWEETGGIYHGFAGAHEAYIKSENDSLVFLGADENEVRNFWINYFDLERDYGAILKKLCGDAFVSGAVEKYGVIRILNQEPWETLCSFIFSACNNIPRIKGIISRLSQALGDEKENGFAFPPPERLAGKEPEELAFLRAGYRAPYIIDAAKRVCSGEIDFAAIRKMPEETARRELMKIHGVGKKVADCTLLFSLGFHNVYPVDRHIDRADKLIYPAGLPRCFDGERGLAQQYIFHRQRTE